MHKNTFGKDALTTILVVSAIVLTCFAIGFTLEQNEEADRCVSQKCSDLKIEKYKKCVDICMEAHASDWFD